MSPSSWTATAAGPRSATCRASSATSRASMRWCARCHACADRGIEYLTVFAFSSENWKRPSEEVSGLMGLVLVAVSKYLAKLAGDGVRIRIVGDRAQVSDKLRQAWQQAEDSTRAQHRASSSRSPSTTAAAGTSSQACRQAIADGVARRSRSTRPGSTATWRCSMRPIPISSSAPAARCASATSCSGRPPIRSSSSPTASGPSSARAELDAAFAQFARRERRFGAVPSAASS